MVRRDIIQKIDQLIEDEKEYVFYLSEVTKFKWDKVVYFKYPTSEEEISRALDVNCTGGTDVSQGFVFAYQGRVVYTDIVGIIPGANRVYLSVKGDSLIVWSKENAVFEGRQFDEQKSKVAGCPVCYTGNCMQRGRLCKSGRIG